MKTLEQLFRANKVSFKDCVESLRISTIATIYRPDKLRELCFDGHNIVYFDEFESFIANHRLMSCYSTKQEDQFFEYIKKDMKSGVILLALQALYEEIYPA